jgi:hypothetical protein
LNWNCFPERGIPFHDFRTHSISIAKFVGDTNFLKLSVQISLPPMPFSVWQNVIYKYEGCASYLQRYLATSSSKHVADMSAQPVRHAKRVGCPNLGFFSNFEFQLPPQSIL